MFSEESSHTTELFQPSVLVAKSGPALSKVGETITYDFTITSTSSADSPDLILSSVSDTVLGDLTLTADAAGCGSLGPDGGSCNFTVDYLILSGDPDPLVNVVDVLYNPEGFPNEITSEATHTVQLFQVLLAIDKTGDDLSKVGDTVDYTITVTNNSPVDAPALNCTVTDTVLGDLFNDVLPLGSTVLTPSRVVVATDPDPLPNTATVSCTAAGFPNTVFSEESSHTTELFQPSVNFDKIGDKTFATIGEVVNYTLTLSNTSSSDSPPLGVQRH